MCLLILAGYDPHHTTPHPIQSSPVKSNLIRSRAQLGLFTVNEVVDSEVLAACSSAHVLHFD